MAFSDIIQVLKFDEKTINRLSKRSEATLPAHLVIVIATFASGLLSLGLLYALQPELFSSAAQVGFLAVLNLLLVPSLTIASAWILSTIFHMFSLLFGGKGSIRGILRPKGHGYAVQLLSWVPYVNLLVLLYQLVLDVKIVQSVERIDLGSAVGVVVLTVVSVLFVLFVLAAVLMLVMVGTLTT